MLLSSTAVAATGDEVYKAKCASCHDQGLQQAPRLGNKADWLPRIGKGRPAMIRSVIYGMPGSRKPPRAGYAQLSDRDLTAAVDYMLSELDMLIDSYSPPARIRE